MLRIYLHIQPILHLRCRHHNEGNGHRMQMGLLLIQQHRRNQGQQHLQVQQNLVLMSKGGQPGQRCRIRTRDLIRPHKGPVFQLLAQDLHFAFWRQRLMPLQWQRKQR